MSSTALLSSLASGAGNRFLLVDGVRGPRPDRADHLAREVHERLGLDGVLLVDRDELGRIRMVIHNADGSRPEACGNGLRCVAAHALAAGLVDDESFEVVTDAGVRSARIADGGVQVSMGEAQILGERTLGVEGSTVTGTVVDVGNPHLVLFPEELDDSIVGRLGPALERHPSFPARINVGFAHPEGELLALRVWERGVGETKACGTGACAAARVAVERLSWAWPVQVELPGGGLMVDSSDGELWLSGPVELGRLPDAMEPSGS